MKRSGIINLLIAICMVAQLSAQNVSPLTGDFSYGLPLITVPGPNGEQYSLALSYSAGIGMEQQATMVGLGWNINIPAIQRNVNGNPDDLLKSLATSYRFYSNGGLTEPSQLTGCVNYCFVNDGYDFNHPQKTLRKLF